LKADPEDHWNRVLKQDPRPITNYPNAFAQLQNLLRQREPFYARADFQIDTSELSLPQCVRQIVSDTQDHFPARKGTRV
jgi:shikimate kinase